MSRNRRHLDENPPRSWFSNFGLNAAMAENPAYMQAIGWQQDREGNYHQDPTNEGARELSKALTEIGINAATEVFGGPILEALTKYGVKQYRGYKNLYKSRKYLNEITKARESGITLGYNPDGTIGDPTVMQAVEKRYNDLIYGENADIKSLNYFRRDTPIVKQKGKKLRVKEYGDRRYRTEIYDTPQEASESATAYLSEKPVTAQDILKEATKDFNRIQPGHTAALVDDYALSQDSYPLLARLSQRRTLQNQGRIIPVIDDGNYRMVRLNSFGKKAARKRNIDNAIKGLREVTGDPNIPGRITTPNNTYVPAFFFKKYRNGGILNII